MNLKTLLNKNKRSFTIYIIGAFMTTGNNLLLTLAIGQSFNILTASNNKEVMLTIIITCLLAFLPILLQICSRYMRIGFMKDTLRDIRVMSYEKLMSMRVNEFSNSALEVYQSKLIADINLFEREFFLSLLNIIFSMGSYLLSIIVLFMISYEVALLTILASFMIFGLTELFKKGILKSKDKVVKENMIYQKALTNILSGLETIKLYQASNRFFGKFESDVDTLEATVSNDYGVNQYAMNIISFTSFFMSTISFVFAANLFSQGKFEIGSLIIVLNLTGSLSWTVNQGMSMINRLKSSIEIYDELVKLEPSDIEPINFTFNDHLKINDVNVNYGGAKILDSLNLEIKNKDKVLIYGESGSGKTTFINTLLKHHTDYDGIINYDNHSLKDINYPSLIESVGYVRQEHFLFDKSILDNIILNAKFDEDKLNSVIKSSSLDKFIEQLPSGYNHQLVENGSNISGGQRQRINIARELYQDKSIIIFDEPSASLDDFNAKIIYESILNLDKTVIIISHRHLDYLQDQVDVKIDLSQEGLHA